MGAVQLVVFREIAEMPSSISLGHRPEISRLSPVIGRCKMVSLGIGCKECWFRMMSLNNQQSTESPKARDNPSDPGRRPGVVIYGAGSNRGIPPPGKRIIPEENPGRLRQVFLLTYDPVPPPFFPMDLSAGSSRVFCEALILSFSICVLPPPSEGIFGIFSISL